MIVANEYVSINEQLKNCTKQRHLAMVDGIIELAKTIRPPPRKEMSHAYIVKQSEEICKTLNALQLGKILSDVYWEHFNGKWNSLQFEKNLKKEVVDRIYRESRKSGEPVLCIVDDTIASHTKPSSQAMYPIEAAYFHQSHLKKCQDYGHQAVSVMLSCNGLSLNYAMMLYDKTRSKIEIVQQIINELPQPPHAGYFLCDSWYTANKLMDAFGEAKALRVFISTHTELSTQEILSLYVKRWHIEVFFRACKQKLAFDKCQLRKKTGITRMWLILSFVHFICCTVVGYVGDFDEGYRYFRNCVLQVALAQNRNSL